MTDTPARPGRRARWWAASRFLVLTLVTALAALAVLVAMLLAIVLVATLPLLPRIARVGRWLADRERGRTARFLGTPIPAPPPPEPDSAGAVLSDPGIRRTTGWLGLHASLGLICGAVVATALLGAVTNAAIALVWPAVPGATTTLDTPVTSWPLAGLALLIAAAYAAVGWFAAPPLARWYARTGAVRLAPSQRSLAERLAEVTATRAAALDAHGTELQRIERDLHDGTQNRLVAVVMQLGMAERALRRDPAAALPMVLTAQNAASDALAELRGVVRSIYPPVLVDRGLSGAVEGLVARSTIPCTLEREPLPRAPAAVESAAYFVVAEALTNAAKHSGAERIVVRLGQDGDALVVEVSDDGHGGADESGGSGLLGIRRRVSALDGTTELRSPAGGPTRLRVTIPTGA